MDIEVLYIRDCPGYPPMLEMIQQIVAEERIQANITSTEVTDIEVTDIDVIDIDVIEPSTAGFHGSPTVRINGRDIENVAGIATCGLACRTYAAGATISNLPSADLIRTAIRRERSPGPHCVSADVA
jgi:hypothetical protein